MLSSRKKFVVGNWKMFKTQTQAVYDFSHLEQLSALAPKDLNAAPSELAIAAPALFLSDLDKISKNVKVFAQNVHFAKEGAYTGEISVPMLKALPHVSGSLVGHSERRQYFSETNASCGQKIEALLRAGMSAIYCVGESLSERQSGQYLQVMKAQIVTAFNSTKNLLAADLMGSNPQNPLFSIAYEPVWAIGTGKSAKASDAQEVHKFIRSVLLDLFGKKNADTTKILYGGSVKANNIWDYLSDSEIDGALVGGASLDVAEFAKMSLYQPKKPN